MKVRRATTVIITIPLERAVPIDAEVLVGYSERITLLFRSTSAAMAKVEWQPAAT